jgi:hypothetical protein
MADTISKLPRIHGKKERRRKLIRFLKKIRDFCKFKGLELERCEFDSPAPKKLLFQKV